MPKAVARPETVISTLTNAYQTLVPQLSTTTTEYADGYRMRRLVGGHVFNADNAAATVILALSLNGAAEVEYARITLDAQYWRYVFNQDDFRDLGTTYAVRIKAAEAHDPALVAIGRYADS